VNASFAAAESIDAIPSDYSLASNSVCEGQKADVTAVGHDRLSHDERESAIKLAGDLVVKYMARATANNGIDYMHFRGLADRARLSMEALIKGRAADWKRPEQASKGLD
jgi:hypothetical protein